MKKLILPLVAAAFMSSTISAADFISTQPVSSPLSFGARLGVNTSNATIDHRYVDEDMESWGTGFTAGFTVDIRFREWFAIQPGFFYESRSNKYTYIWKYDINNPPAVAVGHALNYNFNIPVLFSARFNLSNQLRWSVDFGPYFAFGIGKHDKIEYQVGDAYYKYNDGYYKNRKRFSSGIKFGTGLQFREHYYFGVHYLAGMTDVYKDYGGLAKAWSFTLGYDF